MQSLARGTGNVESDYLNGEISAIAHRCGLLAPINTRVPSIARRAAARDQRPGSLGAEQLARLLDEGLTASGSAVGQRDQPGPA